MTKEQVPSISALPLPFAMRGETVVPVSELNPFSDSGNKGALGFDSKYQWNNSVPPSRFVTRQLMNNLLGQISGRQFLKQCGSLDVFDENVCSAIGGYPQGAVLQYLDDNILYDVVSLRDYNDTDYTKVGIDGTNWAIYGSSVFMYVYPDYGSTGQENILKTWDIHDGGVSSDALTITSPCWIQPYITNPEVSAGLGDYACGIILYGGNTERPSSEPTWDSGLYTVYELTEGGTVVSPVMPVLPGNKICAYSTAAVTTNCSVIIRKLTPVRTR